MTRNELIDALQNIPGAKNLAVVDRYDQPIRVVVVTKENQFTNDGFRNEVFWERIVLK